MNMKKIPLTQGMFAMVDDEDFEWLNQWKWQLHVDRKGNLKYAVHMMKIKGKIKAIRMHRLIMKCKKGFQVDHIDGNGLNNKAANLRICSNSENSRNRSKNRNNTSGFKGVHKEYITCNHVMYRASITKNRKKIFLGLFINPIEAAKVYNKAALKYHGEFARLSPIPSEVSCTQ